MNRAQPCVIVVMGVSGSGKTTVGTMLADTLGWGFADADEFHPQSNRDKMASGTPLDDDDRRPWLDAIAAWIDRRRAEANPGVVTCSALKRRYRDVLIGDREDVALVFLEGDKALLASRMATRRGHFMPTALLQSQLDTLEEPGPEEHPVVVSVDRSPGDIVAEIMRTLDLRPRQA